MRGKTIYSVPDIQELTGEEKLPIGDASSIAKTVKVSTLLKNKQDKLTAGKNITIDENNVISSAGEVTKEYVDDKVAAEESRAQEKESSLEVAISTEQQRAEEAESSLSQRIDTIIQGRNVRDIVGNYDELLAYDTSTLGDNDIVMVLLDETQSGHTTYYRWNLTETTWEFIGGLAFTYTKTEIDDKFRALHIVLPSVPSDAVEHPENYQELLAQIDTMVRGAGADASFKMPVENVGNVDITFVKTNPAHIYLGIFADDRSILYTVNRTTSTPRTYTCEIVEKVFANVESLEEKQDKLIAGDNITIDENNTISASIDTITEEEIAALFGPVIEMVDLGLPSGLKWAKCNIGAEKETDYGMYFKFGDIVGHDAQHCTHDGSIPTVEVDGNKHLLPAYDAATQLIGSTYRMPTGGEMNELINNTNHVVVTVDGIKGMKYSKRGDTDTYIFIPFAGYCNNGSFGGVGSFGFLWSITLYDQDSSYSLRCDSDGDTSTLNYLGRSFGFSVRAVSER